MLPFEDLIGQLMGHDAARLAVAIITFKSILPFEDLIGQLMGHGAARLAGKFLCANEGTECTTFCQLKGHCS